ncbi:MAG TPA: alpha-amylase family protein [Gemmataceae bacterium]|nr:alpha-amylase family protein [Gemmataceae bacterium]
MERQFTEAQLDRRVFLTAASGLVGATLLASGDASPQALPFEPVKIPEWIYGVTRMGFLSPGEVDKAARLGVQVVHGNAIWPYYPLQRDGGGLPADESWVLRKFVADCHCHGMRLVLGLPPFPPVELVKKHPDWRVHADSTRSILKIAPEKDKLGTRIGCNLGPWGDYLIGVCAELVREYGVDGFSFDGNYHPAMCYCPACQEAYRKDRGTVLPERVNLDDIDYREYLVWRGERLEDHYRKLQTRLKQVNPDAVLMSWTVNAGRYGHYLTSPRAMPSRLNRLFDLPMQEWWLDETNLGGSVAPAFGAAYLRATAGDGPNASEVYLMSRGNPYGTDSFPAHERQTRNFLALTNGSMAAVSLGWPGHEASTRTVLQDVSGREGWLTRTRTLPWAALLVSEQTRQFYAYKDIQERFLPHVFGAFRAAMEEHLPLCIINDWDLDPATLGKYAVLVLPNAAALSNKQIEAIRAYVQAGGGLVATAETSLCDELGRPRRDFGLADVFGVSYQGRPKAPQTRPELDANFAVSIDENYWKQRNGIATLTWSDHALVRDARLQHLVPNRSVTFRGPLVRVSKPSEAGAVGMWLSPDGADRTPLPGAVLRSFGKGKVVYLAAALDAALWSYAYPYQRRLLVRAIEWAARQPAEVSITAPMCVQAGYFLQSDKVGRRLIVHLFNGMNTTANHGLPATDVPLREEVVPIHGMEVRFPREAPRSFRLQPGDRTVEVRRAGTATVVAIPPLVLHAMLVGEY